MPELVGPLDAEEAGTTRPARRPVPLQEALLASEIVPHFS